VQRIDALRYFLLYHYGGLYIDMDNGCQRSLEPLLYYPTFVIDPGHGTLMNNILGAAPNHAFWELMTSQLQRYDIWYVFPFVSVMWGAGQWFETQIWEYYHRVILPARRGSGWKMSEEGEWQREGDGQLFRLMRDTRPGAPPPLFFTQGRGRSWDDWDKIYLEWIGDHIVLVLFGGFALGFGAIALLVRYCCLRRRVRKGQEYALLAS
jgi:inositol phosphorylceramide mannosyltransferase catalytic subunit